MLEVLIWLIQKELVTLSDYLFYIEAKSGNERGVSVVAVVVVAIAVVVDIVRIVSVVGVWRTNSNKITEYNLHIILED